MMSAGRVAWVADLTDCLLKPRNCSAMVISGRECMRSSVELLSPGLFGILGFRIASFLACLGIFAKRLVT